MTAVAAQLVRCCAWRSLFSCFRFVGDNILHIYGVQPVRSVQYRRSICTVCATMRVGDDFCTVDRAATCTT